MKYLLEIVTFVIIWTTGVLLALLLGHIISLAFGHGWVLSEDAKGACAVFGAILGFVMAISYFIQKSEDN